MKHLTEITNDEKARLYYSMVKGDGFSGFMYSVTFTLHPHLYRKKAWRQLRDTYAQLSNILRYNTNLSIVVPELTKKGAIHYHAICNMSKLQRMVLVDDMKSSKSFGSCYVNEHVIGSREEFDRTVNYMMKEITLTKVLVRNEAIIWIINKVEKRKLAMNIELIDRIDMVNDKFVDIPDDPTLAYMEYTHDMQFK